MPREWERVLQRWQALNRDKKVACPAEAGVSAASAAHLANESLKTGQVAVWKA